MTFLNQIIELAKQVESTDPIDWGMIPLDEDATYALMATSVLEQFSLIEVESQKVVLLSIIVKLVVENFVLNYKLTQGK